MQQALLEPFELMKGAPYQRLDWQGPITATRFVTLRRLAPHLGPLRGLDNSIPPLNLEEVPATIACFVILYKVDFYNS